MPDPKKPDDVAQSPEPAKPTPPGSVKPSVDKGGTRLIRPEDHLGSKLASISWQSRMRWLDDGGR